MSFLSEIDEKIRLFKNECEMAGDKDLRAKMEDVLYKISEARMQINSSMSEYAIRRMINDKWLDSSSLKAYIEGTQNITKKSKSQNINYCPHCNGILMNNGDKNICDNCSYTEDTYIITRSNTKTKTHFERGKEEFCNWIVYIQGNAQIPQKVSAKETEIINDVRIGLKIYLKNKKIDFDEFNSRKKTRDALKRARYTFKDYPSDADMRKIFKKHGLADSYKYCTTLRVRATYCKPEPEINNEDFKEMLKMYEHILSHYDNDRNNPKSDGTSKISNNRTTPTAIKFVMTKLELDEKYLAVFTMIPPKKKETENSIFKLLESYMMDYQK
jgi:hypothetical protein